MSMNEAERGRRSARRAVGVPVARSAGMDLARALGGRTHQDHYYNTGLGGHVWQLTVVCQDGRVLGTQVVVSDQELLAARHPASLVQAKLDWSWEQLVRRMRGAGAEGSGGGAGGEGGG